MSQITVEKTAEDSASKSLRVTVPVDRVREAEAKAVKYYAQRARLPGFRPGKAPEAVVRKRFGDAIRQTVLEEVIRESWETAKTSESLKPIADPSIRNLKFEDGSPIEFDLLVEVRPELKLERTGGFRVERRVAPVADGAVEEQLAARPGAEGAPGSRSRATQAVARADGPGGGGADRGRHAGRGAAVRPRAGPEPGDPGPGGADHGAPARRDRRGRGQVPRGPSGREPAGPGAGSVRVDPARGEAAGAAAARRRLRPRGRRLREPRRAPRRRPPGPGARGRAARPTPRCGRRWSSRSSRPTGSRRRSRWCTG